MDALLYMSETVSDIEKLFHLPSLNLGGFLWGLRETMKSSFFKDFPVDDQQTLIMILRETAPKVGKIIGEFVGHAPRKQSSSSETRDLEREYRSKIKALIYHIIKDPRLTYATRNTLYAFETREEYYEIVERILNDIDTALQSNIFKNIENMLLEEADISNSITLDNDESSALFWKKTFPNLFNMPNDHERHMFCYKLVMELGSSTLFNHKPGKEQPLVLLLIGGLLSLKPIANNIWKRVKDDLDKIKEIPAKDTIEEIPFTQHNGQQHLKSKAYGSRMWHIIAYFYNDLPYFLQQCFLYFACYPVSFEIPTTSLTQIWIAEGFVEEEDKQTSLETTANKYLDELVQRSLVFVSKRSLLGTIKSCRLPHSIHEFAIQQSYMEGFSVANPDQEEIESRLRISVYPDNKKQCSEVKNNHIRSFLALNFDRNVLGSALLLKVLALRNSAIPVTTLPNMIYLRYFSLRGSNISKLPENIEQMENLQTLDVRGTSIETIPKSLWNIKTLRHVYVKPSPQIKGPPSTTHIDNLQTLKTVVAHESWVENIPYFLIHLTKLALSNWDNLDWKSISNLLSHMDKLISLSIMGKIMPSEFLDLRAFPNLETVKSIKLEGEWNCRKLFIDHVQFPPNLAKLTLTRSGLKEDPMPMLERLQALKFLSLKDGAYKGKQMVCSTNGFPQLQFLELEKLENLENWEVKPTAMSQLTTLRVVHCRKLNILPWIQFLRRVTITDIDD